MKIDCGDGCVSVNMVKTTELYLNGRNCIVCELYLNTVVIKIIWAKTSMVIWCDLCWCVWVGCSGHWDNEKGRTKVAQ